LIPSIFIGSTIEGKDAAEYVANQLAADFAVKPWFEGVFEIGGTTQASLVNAISSCDYCIIILTADDNSRIRGKNYLTPRDNLLFEAGISFGSVHSSRTFLISEKVDKLKLPSDLNGFTGSEGQV
jgi:CRP/FNR family transcriptional regulator, cyclic AMP receptor protein